MTLKTTVSSEEFELRFSENVLKAFLKGKLHFLLEKGNVLFRKGDK